MSQGIVVVIIDGGEEEEGEREGGERVMPFDWREDMSRLWTVTLEAMVDQKSRCWRRPTGPLHQKALIPYISDMCDDIEKVAIGKVMGIENRVDLGMIEVSETDIVFVSNLSNPFSFACPPPLP